MNNYHRIGNNFVLQNLGILFITIDIKMYDLKQKNNNSNNFDDAWSKQQEFYKLFWNLFNDSFAS